MHGLYLLWWVQEKHMSAAVVASALAAGDLALALLEVPTGWFADRFGHRASLITGSTVQVLGMLCCWLGQGMPGLIAASLLVALGDGFRSGADQALLYRSCVCLGREEGFQPIEARTRAVQLAAMVGLVLAGGAIVKTCGFEAGWAIETALCAVGMAIACAMVEPPATARSDDSDRSQRRDHLAPLIALMLPAALLGGGASVTAFLAQTTGHSEPVGITLLVAIATLAEAAGSTLAIRVRRAGLGAQVILASLGAASIAVAVAFPVLFLPVVVVLAFLFGIAHPLRAVAIQRHVADGGRARAASLASACDMGVSVMALPLAGAWRQRRRR